MTDADGTSRQPAPPEADEEFARVLAESAERLRAGEETDAVVGEHPEWTARLRRLLPTIRAMEPDPCPAPAIDMGDFRTLRVIGRGGMGIVYEAMQISLGRRVALKILPLSHASDPDRLRRFRTEAQAAAALRHPHIVPVHVVGTERGVPYFAMQLIEGRSLAQLVAECRAGATRPTPRDVAELGRQAALALHAAHEQGVVHRDVKPSNLLVDSQGWLWVADFGLALLQQSQGTTATGVLLGTPRYMSPEQVLGDRAVVDHRVDIYALGATLYELLTLRPAFDGEGCVELPRRIVEEEPLPARRIDRSIPRDLETIVLTAMAKEPMERYPTAAALAADLGRFLDDRPIQARPPDLARRLGRWARRHRPAVATVAVLVPALLLGSGAVLAWRNALLRQHSSELAQAHSRADRHERLTRRYAYVTQIRLADQALAAERVVDAQDILDGLRAAPGEEDPRGFEWSFLRDATHREISALARHDGPVLAMAASEDGRTLASAGEDGILVLWDLAGGRERARRRAHDRPVDRLCLSSDGRFIATACRRRSEAEPCEIALWDATTGDELGRVGDLDGSAEDLVFAPSSGLLAVVIRAAVGARTKALAWDVERRLEPPSRRALGQGTANLAYSPDGRYLATSDQSGHLVVTEQATRRIVCESVLNYPFTCLSFSPDGERLAVGSHRGLKTFDVERCEASAEFPMPPTRFAFTPDGRRVAGHAAKGDVFIYEYENNNRLLLRSIYSNLHPGPIHDSTLSPDGGLLAICGGQVVPTIWETRTGKVLFELRRPTGEVRRVCFSKDGRSLFLACGDGRVRAWHFAPRTASPAQFAGHPAEVWALTYSPDSATLISAADDHLIRLWDSRTGASTRELRGHEALVSSLAVTADGRRLASAGYDGVVRLWELAGGRPSRALRGHDGSVRAVTFSPDGRTLASGGTDGTVRVWGSTSGRAERVLVGHRNRVRGVAFDPKGRYLASTGDDRTVRVTDTSTWTERVVLDRPKQGGALAFSPDGSLLITGDDAGEITAWDVGPWSSRTFARTADVPVWGVAFSPDGRTLAAACGDGRVRLLDPVTGELLLTLQGHKSRVNTVAFAPDGRTLASASHDGALRIWRGSAP